MKKYVISLDAGTTSNRAVVFDQDLEIVDIAQQEFNQIYPKAGWVEHDANEIWQTQLEVLRAVFNKGSIAQEDVAAIGITNQRETTILWDRNTGQPICNAIVWQDRRTSEYCQKLKEAGHAEVIRQKTGLVIDAYFSGTKIKWMLDHVEGARARAEQGELAFGTVETWLVWNLTKGALHITDVSNASRTMLFNINTLTWDADLLNLLGVPAGILPDIVDSSTVYGHVHPDVLAGNIPIAGMAGDQQASLFGQLCHKKGMVKNTYGTGCFVMMNTGDKPNLGSESLIATIAWKVGGQVMYATEGSIFIGGALVQWLRDNLKIVPSAPEIESLAAAVKDSGGVVIVPAFVGLGAPHWDQFARGTIFGITRGTSSAHIARAALEAIALQVKDAIDAMQKEGGVKVTELRVDGGASNNNLLMQIQADLSQCNVVRPKITETTALGAALLAGLAVQFWKDDQDIASRWHRDKSFAPVSGSKNEPLIHNWNKALERSKNWLDN